MLIKIKKPFEELSQDPKALADMTRGMESAIKKSFAVDKSRATQDEIKRRFRICADIFETLKKEYEWGNRRIIDTMPKYLRCELDGKQWEPDKRTVWVPEDGTI